VLQELTTVRGDGEQLRLRLEEKQAQLETLNGEIEQRDVALAAARAEGHATTLQLHHVQEGLENSFKAHQQAQKDQLQANREFQSKREQQLMAERQADLEKVLAALHQTEEELEHYFLQTQHGRQLVDAQQVQLQRGAALLRRMAALKGVTTGYPLSQPIQVMALLEGYRQSLKRAERLLGREVFSGEASRISE
jgi:chromosome segregation ATPase